MFRHVSDTSAIGTMDLDDSIYSLFGPASIASIASNMSYASRRRASVAEDLACCLPGPFDVNVNMPLVRGQGHMAFWRLQEQS